MPDRTELVGALYRLGRGSLTDHDAELIADALLPVAAQPDPALSESELTAILRNADERADYGRDYGYMARCVLRRLAGGRE